MKIKAVSLRFDPPYGDLARRSLAMLPPGDGVEILLNYPLTGNEAARMPSGEIRDRVRFHLREMARMAAGIRILRARCEGWLARTAARDPRIALAVAHGVLASFTGIPLAAEAGSLLARQARRLGLATGP